MVKRCEGFRIHRTRGSDEDIFAHFSAIQMDGFRTLKQGAKVTYDVVAGPKGQLAQNIVMVEPPPYGAKQRARAETA